MEKETTAAASCPVEKLELRRDVSVWGSYMWGYADVGADIYAALGLVMGAAHSGASLAFFVAGLIYIRMAQEILGRTSDLVLRRAPCEVILDKLSVVPS